MTGLPLKLKATLSAVVLASAVLCGCSHQSGLVGKWAGSGSSGDGGTAAYTYDFHSDGLVEVSAKTIKAPSSPSLGVMLLGNPSNIHLAATYAVKEDVLTLTPKSVTLLDDKGQPPPLTPTIKQDPQVIRYKISGNTLTLDHLDGDKPLTLTRQKGTE